MVGSFQISYGLHNSLKQNSLTREQGRLTQGELTDVDSS